MDKYGGFFPLELPERGEYYNDEYNLLRLNCGRAAIYRALIQSKAKKIYIPYYICTSTVDPIKKVGIEYEYYNINEYFMPQNVNLENDEYILWVNYYGVVYQNIIDNLVNKYENLIIDNIHAFFSNPIDNAYNIYSTRKFFGVSDEHI